MKKFSAQLFKLQNVFYADGRFSLLIIFQGIDTAGKDGSIRHVMSCMNPMGIQVKSFKKPTAEELQHDFLWRTYPHFPAKGMIAVFNRSYYEDILVPSIERTLSGAKLDHRSRVINQLEEHLEECDTHVIKFFLHVSKQEQKKRIEQRLTKPSKQWKYAPEDIAVSDHWDDYMRVYDQIIHDCRNPPWHVIPADKRWYRNFVVSKILTQYIDSLQLRYPKL